MVRMRVAKGRLATESCGTSAWPSEGCHAGTGKGFRISLAETVERLKSELHRGAEFSFAERSPSPLDIGEGQSGSDLKASLWIESLVKELAKQIQSACELWHYTVEKLLDTREQAALNHHFPGQNQRSPKQTCKASFWFGVWSAVQKCQQMVHVPLVQGRPAQVQFLGLRVHSWPMRPKRQCETHRRQESFTLSQAGPELAAASIRSMTIVAFAFLEQLLPDHRRAAEVAIANAI